MKQIVTLFTLMLLIGIGSAETIIWGNYSWQFNMSEPHIIDGTLIRTYYGGIFPIWCSDSPEGRSNSIGTIYLYNAEAPIFKDDYGGYVATLVYCPPNEKFLTPGIYSTMNLSSTIDFLRTLRVTPINQTAQGGS